jgi:hypothetical protein
VFLLAIGLVLCLSQGPALAQTQAMGCDANYPVLTDKNFKDLVAIMDLGNQPEGQAKVNDYLNENKIDAEEMILGMNKLTLNIEDRMNPTSKVIDQQFASCVDKVRFNQDESKLLEKYFQDFMNVSAGSKKQAK